MTREKDKFAVVPMFPGLWQNTKRAAKIEGMSASAYTRIALLEKLQRDGYIMHGPAGAQIVPIVKYSVDFRSADGNLNTEVIPAKDEADVRKVFDGSNVINITKL